MDKYDLHKKLCEDIHSTYVAKNKDYGDSFTDSINEWGLVASMVRIGDKYNRLKTLIKNPNNQHVKDESIIDTYMDMANYCLMSVMAIKNILPTEDAELLEQIKEELKD